MRLTSVRTLFILIVLCGLTMPAQAQFSGLISGEMSGNGMVTLLTSTTSHEVLSFSGDDTRFGPFTGDSSSDRDFSNLAHQVISNGMFTEDFSNGTLHGDFTGVVNGNGKGVGTFSFNFVITGGTGAFDDSTGTVTLTGTSTRTSATTYGVAATYTGTLNAPRFPVPEPTACQMGPGIVLSLGGLGLRRMRRLRA